MGLAISQITAQVCCRSIGRPLEIERGHEPAGFVHQIDNGRVVHGVTTLVERNLFEIDPVSLCDCRDRGRIIRLDFERFIFGRAASLRLEAVKRCVGARFSLRAPRPAQ